MRYVLLLSVLLFQQDCGPPQSPTDVPLVMVYKYVSVDHTVIMYKDKTVDRCLLVVESPNGITSIPWQCDKPEKLEKQ